MKKSLMGSILVISMMMEISLVAAQPQPVPMIVQRRVRTVQNQPQDWQPQLQDPQQQPWQWRSQWQASQQQQQQQQQQQIKQQQQLAASIQDVVYLTDGTKITGHLAVLPPLVYQFGSLPFRIQDAKKVKFSMDQGSWKMYVENTDGTNYISDFADGSAIEVKGSDGQLRQIPFIDIISIDVNTNKSNVKINQSPQIFMIGFRDGSLLPVKLNDAIQKVNDGQKDYDLPLLSIIDIQNDNGLHGIVLTKEGEYKHIPLALLRDQTIPATIIGSNKPVELNWSEIKRIYKHNFNNASKETLQANSGTVVPSEPANTSVVPSINGNDLQRSRPGAPQPEQRVVPQPTLPSTSVSPESEPQMPAIFAPSATPKPATPATPGPEANQLAFLAGPKVIGRISTDNTTPGAKISSQPSDIKLIGESITYEPKKKSLKNDDEDDAKEEGTKDDDSKGKQDEFQFSALELPEKKYSVANGGAIRKPLLVKAAGLKDELIAMGEPVEEKSQEKPLNDEDGYYNAPTSKIDNKETEDQNDPSAVHDPDLAGMVYINQTVVQCDAEGHSPASQETAKAFYIDKYPVTNRQYYRFLKATNYPRPKSWPGGRLPRAQELQPIVNISYKDAEAYAEWAGKKIPTAAEWCRANNSKQIKLSSSTKKISEWTSTSFALGNDSKAEKNWMKQNNVELAKTAYRAVISGSAQSAIPLPEEDFAANIGFRTALEEK